MKLEFKTQDLDCSENFENASIGIEEESAPLIISALTDRLYPNPLKTGMIELFSNGLDSHISAGKEDVPVKISLPTVLSPYFKIRDYGVSMSHQTVMTIYNKLGKSTKRDSDDAVGGFGIGKFSILGYGTRSMQISTFINGVKRNYFMHLKDGSGGIKPISTEETSEPNGVEIRVKILEKDFTVCHSYAKEIYSFCKPLPQIVGVSDFKFKNTDSIISGNGWKILKSNDHSKVTIRGLAFPVSCSYIPSWEYEDRKLLSKGLVMDFEVGELDVVPSRTDLLYNEKTIANLEARLVKVKEEVKQQLKTKIENSKSYFDACVLYKKFKDDAFESILPSDMLFNGQELSIYFGCNFSCIENYRFYKKGKAKIRRIHLVCKEKHIFAKEDAKIYVNDVADPKSVKMRLYTLLKDKDYNYELNVVDKAYFNEESYQKSSIINVPHIKLSSIAETELPKIKRNYTSQATGRNASSLEKAKEKCFTLKSDCVYSTTPSDHWDSTDVDFDKGGIYVELHRYGSEKYTLDYDNLRSLIQLCKEAGAISDFKEVIGVKKSQSEKFDSSDNWVEISDYCLEFFKKQHPNLELDFVDYDYKVKDTKLKNAALKIKSEVLKPFQERMEEVGKIGFVNRILRFYLKNKITTNNIPVEQTAEYKLKQIAKKCPAFSLAAEIGYLTEGHIEIVKNYLDKEAKNK